MLRQRRSLELPVLRRLPDSLVDPDVDGVASLFADRLAEGCLDREPVRAVALSHERADERFAVNDPADLHKPSRAEPLDHVVDHNAGPRTWVITLLKAGIELAQHAD